MDGAPRSGARLPGVALAFWLHRPRAAALFTRENDRLGRINVGDPTVNHVGPISGGWRSNPLKIKAPL